MNADLSSTICADHAAQGWNHCDCAPTATPLGAKLGQPVNLSALAFIIEAVQTSCSIIASAPSDLEVASLENVEVGFDGAMIGAVLVVEFVDTFSGESFFCAATPGTSQVAVGMSRDAALEEWGDL